MTDVEAEGGQGAGDAVQDGDAVWRPHLDQGGARRGVVDVGRGAVPLVEIRAGRGIHLDDFAGALIVVSHDRYFLDRTVESIFKFEDEGRIREFAGDYSTYLETVARESIENKEAETRASARVEIASTPEKPKSNKLSFKEKRELEQLEALIPETETRLASIEKELAQFATDSFKLNELFNEQQTLTARLEQSIERWAELAERADL